MKIYEEKSLLDFNFWSGAKDTVKYLTEDELDTIEEMLNEYAPDGMSEGEVNDFFWFEDDTIAEWLGYHDFEEIMHRGDPVELAWGVGDTVSYNGDKATIIEVDENDHTYPYRISIDDTTTIDWAGADELEEWEDEEEE